MLRLKRPFHTTIQAWYRYLHVIGEILVLGSSTLSIATTGLPFLLVRIAVPKGHILIVISGEMDRSKRTNYSGAFFWAFLVCYAAWVPMTPLVRC